MRRWKTILLLIAVSVVATALIIVYSPPRTSIKLSDGSILRVENVSYGNSELFTRPNGWWPKLREKIVPHLPKALASYVPKPPVIATKWPTLRFGTLEHTNADALNIWITRRDAATGGFKPVEAFWAELLDEHGCKLLMTQVNGKNPSNVGPGVGLSLMSSELQGFRFEAFPRHQKTFILRIFPAQFDTTKPLAEFTILNPAYAPLPAQSHASTPLPVRVTQDDVTFTLASMTIKKAEGRTNYLPSVFAQSEAAIPSFEVFEHGVVTREWEPVSMELWDSDGNFASWLRLLHTDSLFLCPKVPEWRLVVEFCGSELSPFASNSSWTIQNVKVPKPGEFITFSESRNLLGAKIRPIALAGAGETAYNGETPTNASVSTTNQSVFEYSGFSGSYGPKTITSTKPHLAVVVSGMPGSQRLSIRAHDDHGRDSFARSQQYTVGQPIPKPMTGRYLSWADVGLRSLDKGESGQLTFLLLDLPNDANTVDLTFCVHNPRTVEFKFKPPTR